MRYSKLLVALSLLLLFASCKKGHYDVTNVNGVNAEGELLLPVAHKSFTMMDMMVRFQMDSLVSCSETGELSYGYSFEDYGVLNGQRLLQFNDLNYHDLYAFENPYPVSLPISFDSVLSFEHTIVFEANDISVLEAVMKSGRIDFYIETNVGSLNRVVLRSPEFKDASGHDFVLDLQPQSNSFGFDLTDLNFASDVANTLTLSYELYCTITSSDDPELYVDFNIEGRELAMSKVRGFMNPYSSRNTIDTVVSLFPGNLAGMLELENIRMKVSERNFFPLSASLVVDTALMTIENQEPFSIFSPMPLSVDLPSQNSFDEVYTTLLNGKLNASGGRLFASSEFVVNPTGAAEMITVADTCSIDVKIDLEVPFSFRIDEVNYFDTVNMKLSEIDMPDLIEAITLELSFTSTLPLNLNGQFFMYDSENGVITDTLINNAQLIQASFDGQPTKTMVSVDITEGRVQNVLHSDRIIMAYALDTDAHDMKLNANQNLGLEIKGKVKYNGVVEF
jgi:hypothetical protein